MFLFEKWLIIGINRPRATRTRYCMVPTRDGSILVQVTPRPGKLFLKQMEPRFLEHPSEHLKKFKCISIYINIPKSLMHKQCNTSLSYISLKGIFKALSEGRGSGSKILKKKNTIIKKYKNANRSKIFWPPQVNSFLTISDSFMVICSITHKRLLKGCIIINSVHYPEMLSF